MKKITFLVYITLCVFITNTLAQLPPAAQELYDEAWSQDSLMVKYADNNGAQIIATQDGNSFYIKWFPNGATPSSSPLIVSLHGSGGYAFHEFFNWHSQAQLHGCGIIALQWYRGNSSNPPDDYFDETAIYNYIDSALTEINYPSGKAFLHGFSRGSARSYAVIFKDIQSGKNYFCTTLSNAGGADSTYPLYSDINDSVYGTNVFSGKHWALFCAGQDSNPTQSGCIGMTNTQTWLQSQGATIDLFIQDTNMQHDGFQQQQPQIYRDSVLNYYLQCFNNTLTVTELFAERTIRAFPNPSTVFITVQFDSIVSDAELFLYDLFGNEIKTISEFSGNEIAFSRDNLKSGVYFIYVRESNKPDLKTKLIISD